MNLRRKKTVYLLMLCASIAALLTACKNKRSENNFDITYDSIVVDTKIPLLLENDTTLPFSEVKISYTYPIKFQNKENLTRLQQIFNGTFFSDVEYDEFSPNDALNKYLENYTEEYRKLSNQYYEVKDKIGNDKPMWFWYMLNIENSILFQNDSLVCYTVNYYDFQGGAHGSHQRTNFIIDLNNLVTISEDQIFIPGFNNALKGKIVEALMRQYNAETKEDLIEEGFFTIDDVVPNNNFWLDDKGIYYVYNQYEIAPYSMGAIEVFLPYSDLKELILPESVVAKCFIAER